MVGVVFAVYIHIFIGRPMLSRIWKRNAGWSGCNCLGVNLLIESDTDDSKRDEDYVNHLEDDISTSSSQTTNDEENFINFGVFLARIFGAFY